MKTVLARLSPQQNLFFGFLLYILIGAVILYLPFSQKTAVGFTDALFMSASAVSTTGLATVSTFDSFNLFGQGVIALLIQIGGIGYMTFSSFVILSGWQKLEGWRAKLLNAEFCLPQGFVLRDFLKATIIYTLVIEALGMIALFIAFKMEGVETSFALWSSFFHSISSFCTAGFGLYNDSFEQFKHSVPINAIISILSILGALGFIVATDLYYKITRTQHRITLTTKIIVSVFFGLTSVATVFMYLYEPSLQQETGFNAIMIAFFQVMSAITTVGFNSVPIGNLSTGILLLITFMMFVGASPAGTGGGLKSTTLTAAGATVLSRLRGNLNVFFIGKQIPAERVSIATSAIILYTAFIFLGTFLLTCLEPQTVGLEKILFEVASALGTVGLSTGITGSLCFSSKLVLILLMYVGRLGVLTFGISLLQRRQNEGENSPQELAPDAAHTAETDKADLVV